MSAIIMQMVFRKRAAEALAAANAAAYASLVAQAKGEPGMTWRGPYDRTVTYEKNDVISFKGSSYVALVDDPAAPPGDDWDIVAAAGKPGKAGTAGKTVVYSGGGGSNELDMLHIADPAIVPDTIAVKQQGVWRQMLWADFLAMIGSSPVPQPGQVTVGGIGITVGGEPVFVTAGVLPGQITVGGVGITVEGEAVYVTSGLAPGQITVGGDGVTVSGEAVTLTAISTQQVFVDGVPVTIDGELLEVTI